MRISDWSSDVCSSDLRLGFSQAERGDRTDFLDDVDLLATVIDEDDVEFGLLFSGRCSIGSSRASNGNSSGGGNAPLLFPSLGQFSGFQNGQFGKLVNESVNVCHVSSEEQTVELQGIMRISFDVFSFK